MNSPDYSKPDVAGDHVLEHFLHKQSIVHRHAGGTIELPPPLVFSEDQMGEIADRVAASTRAAA